MYAFVHRPLVAPRGTSDGPACDVISPYGYGGPLAWGTRSDEHASVFWSSWDAWARDAGVVSEFVRFSLFADEVAAYPGSRQTRSQNVVRSLALDDEALWRDVDHKVRKNVNRARASGLRVEVDARGARLDAFLAIYHATMDRRSATSGFYFGREYFERLHAALGAQCVFFHVLRDDVVVSTEVVLTSASRAYSFLGGTEAEAFPLRPNDLLKWEIMRWSRDVGLDAYVLGGGPQPGDGIYPLQGRVRPLGRRALRHRHPRAAPGRLRRARGISAMRSGRPSSARGLRSSIRSPPTDSDPSGQRRAAVGTSWVRTASMTRDCSASDRLDDEGRHSPVV